MRVDAQINLQLTDVLLQWNPYRLKDESYDTEIADVIQAVHEIDDREQLAKRIQQIYEFSFEEVIPLEDCLKVSDELLIIKSSGSCPF
ncbi:DUF1871 family protein [Bacillota bacterium Lsc_1132]